MRFICNAGLVGTGDMVSYPLITKTCLGLKKKVELYNFQIGRVTTETVVLMGANGAQDIEVSRTKAVLLCEEPTAN